MTLARSTVGVVAGLLLSGLLVAQDQDSEPAEPVVVSAVPDQLPPREAGEIFLAGNAAYERGDFDTAITEYRRLIELDRADGRIHFNLGNAYLRNGELGRAIAEFRRGRNLRPRDEDIRANLQFGRESATDAILPPEPSPVLSTLLFWHYRMSRAELAALAVVFGLVFWGLAIVRLFRRRSEILGWLLIAFGGLLLGSLGSLAGHRFFTQPVAVIIPQEIEAYTAPDTESVVRFKLHAGTELRLRDEREGWLRITLPDGQQGWVEAVWAEVVSG